MTVTKEVLVEQLVNELGLNGREAKEFVGQFFEEITGQLAQGRQVKLSDFGNFNVRKKMPRPGRNPKAGETVPITAQKAGDQQRRVVTFMPGQKLRATIAGNAEVSDN